MPHADSQYLADISSCDSNTASIRSSLNTLSLRAIRNDMPVVNNRKTRQQNLPASAHSLSSSDLSDERLRHASTLTNHVSAEDSSGSDQVIDIKDMPHNSAHCEGHQVTTVTTPLQDKIKELKSSKLTMSSTTTAEEKSHLPTLTENALTGGVMDKHGLNDLSDPASSTSHSMPCYIDSSEFSL